MNTSVLSGSHVMQAFLIATAFVFWPTVSKYSQVSGPWINTLVLLFSTMVGGLLALPEMRASGLPSFKGIAILAFAGLINGAAVYFYSVRAADAQTPTGSFIAITIVGMLIMGLVFSYFLNSEPITERKLLGLAAAGLAAYLFTGK